MWHLCQQVQLQAHAARLPTLRSWALHNVRRGCSRVLSRPQASVVTHKLGHFETLPHLAGSEHVSCHRLLCRIIFSKTAALHVAESVPSKTLRAPRVLAPTSPWTYYPATISTCKVCAPT